MLRFVPMPTTFFALNLQAFTRPRRALDALVAHPRRATYGAAAFAIAAAVYQAVYFFLARNGGRPTVFKPWLAIPAEEYYLSRRSGVAPSAPQTVRTRARWSGSAVASPSPWPSPSVRERGGCRGKVPCSWRPLEEEGIPHRSACFALCRAISTLASASSASVTQPRSTKKRPIRRCSFP